MPFLRVDVQLQGLGYQTPMTRDMTTATGYLGQPPEEAEGDHPLPG